METFSSMTYKRPDMDAFNKDVEAYMEAFGKAADFAQANALFLKLENKKSEIDTMAELAFIRNSIDTTDAFYEGEVEFLAEALPMLDLKMKAVHEQILSSEFEKDFEKEYGDIFIKNIKNAILFANEDNVQNQVKETLLSQKYTKIAAVSTTTFHGEEVNFYGLLKYMQSTDRAVRKEAMEAWADLYASIAGQLDDIFDEMMEVRMQMANTLGFKDYVEMSYQMRQRFEYTKEDVQNFRRQIKEVLVPLCSRLYDEQKARLGVDALHYYDEGLVFPEGNAVPEGTAAQMVSCAQKMYHELSKETGEFFDFMVKYELFDLETKPGKQQGGYCTFISKYKAPFIFSNFNKTSADVDVLTHEAGHAFEAYTASRRFPLQQQVWSSMEVAEIHSMSMEYFTYPWMELFFGENADKYRYAHLVSGVTFIPYIICVDEFQHRVYEEKADAARRREIWKELEETYMPWRNYDGNAFLEGGGFWMQKPHIFVNPFYYIDYALAHMGALEYYGRMQKDREAAWEDYYRLCCAGGSKGYFDLLKVGNLSNPFAEGTVERIIESIKQGLE